MVGVAVNVTEVPAHIVVAGVEITTEAGKLAFTVIVIELLAPDKPCKRLSLNLFFFCFGAFRKRCRIKSIRFIFSFLYNGVNIIAGIFERRIAKAQTQDL